MKPLLLVVALLAAVTLTAKDPAPPADGKVVVLEPLTIRERPILSFAVDLTIYADPATHHVSRIFISRVGADTDAEKAGLQAGDEIVGLGGKSVKEFEARVAADSELGRLLLARDPGESLAFEVITHRTQQVTLRAQRPPPWVRP